MTDSISRSRSRDIVPPLGGLTLSGERKPHRKSHANIDGEGRRWKIEPKMPGLAYAVGRKFLPDSGWFSPATFESAKDLESGGEGSRCSLAASGTPPSWWDTYLRYSTVQVAVVAVDET